jgi:hypothetical protein
MGARKGMLGAYDFEGSGPDYSSKAYNITYYIGVFFFMGLIIIEVVKKFANSSLPHWGRRG